jgi:hypothetical protein
VARTLEPQRLVTRRRKPGLVPASAHRLIGLRSNLLARCSEPLTSCFAETGASVLRLMTRHERFDARCFDRLEAYPTFVSALYDFAEILAQVSLRVTMRLNTGTPGFESFVSTQ